MNTSSRMRMRMMTMTLLTTTISLISGRKRGVDVGQLAYLPNGGLRESQKVNVAHLIFRRMNGGGKDGRVG